jgi:iron complex transport system substrate-binding protein
MPRIVSLLASATEIVCALGFEKDLVGRSHECDYPPSVQNLPVCTEPKFDVHGSSRDVHERVQAIVEQALAVYRVRADVLRELRPDVIVTQTHCAVCAVSESDVEAALADWLGERPRVVSLRPNVLTDVANDIRLVGQALGAPEERVRGLLDRMLVQMAAVNAAVRWLTPPTVACIEWLDPLMAAGHWMPELVEMAAGVCVFGEPGKSAPRISLTELFAADPEVIVILPCGFDIGRTRQEMPVLTRHPAWPRLQAVQNRRVYLLDGNQYFNRPGPRLVRSLQILAEVLHPGTQPRDAGEGWERL